MLKKINLRILISLLCTIVITGCSKDNPVSQTETLVYQRDGVIESFGGDCSAVQIRTSSLGSIDFTNVTGIKFNLDGSSDADLSSINIYYLDNGVQVNLVDLPHRDQINSTMTIETASPNVNSEIFLRLTLKSSVCTGQIFHIEIRDLKIYTLQ
ncbi:MAG: hypothetical protein ABIY50_08680 [Ignavibacteria bacterium]